MEETDLCLPRTGVTAVATILGLFTQFSLPLSWGETEFLCVALVILELTL